MALIKCPECELQISDKAISCPHCGLPLKTSSAHSYKPHKRRMRLPNGFGQISEIKGRPLRKPFRAMVTVGFTETGRPISRILKPEGYFKTYNEAYEALVEYNKDPYTLEDAITVQELYNRWSEEYFKSLSSQSSIRTITAAWAYCDDIKNIRVKDLRARHIKDVINHGSIPDGASRRMASPNTKGRIKSLFNVMLDYAVEYELTDKNYARTFDLSGDIVNEREEAKRGHMPFTDEEISLLWSHIDDVKYADALLVQCYSGLRPQELGLIRTEDVNIKERFMVGGIKTAAGKNRIIPIHDAIYPIIMAKYKEAVENGYEYLLTCTDGLTHTDSNKLTYDKYQQRFKQIVNRLHLNPEHRAHDGRMHFITQAKKYNVDEYAIKYIVGHAVNDITEKVYTKRETDWLLSEINKIEK